MADNTLSIIAVLKAKAGCRESLKSALQAFVQQMDALLAEPLQLVRLNAVEPQI